MQFHLEELNQATVTLWSLSNSFVHNKDGEWSEGQFELRPKNQGQLNPNSQYRIAIEAIKGMKYLYRVFRLKMAVELKRCTFDLILVKPKYV